MWKKRKSRKRFSGKWHNFFWIIPCFLILVLIYFLFTSGFLNIKHVDVRANQLKCADENQIRIYADIVGQNFFLISSVILEKNLKKKFPCIKSILMSKNFPNKITLQVLSRQPVALLVTLKEKEASASSLVESIATPSAQEMEDANIVDSEGVVFSKDTNEFHLPKVYIYNSQIILGKRFEDNLISNSLVILEKVKIFGMEVAQSWIIDNLFIVVSSTGGTKVIFNLDEKIDIQLASLQLILDKAKIDLKELEFIDLRFDKPVVRFAPKNHGQRQSYLRNRCWFIKNSYPYCFS